MHLPLVVLLAVELGLRCHLFFKFEEHWIKTAVTIMDDRCFKQTCLMQCIVLDKLEIKCITTKAMQYRQEAMLVISSPILL